MENILLVIIGGVQFAFQNYIFQCPHTRYKEYANLVLATPMFLLFCLSTAIHQTFDGWNILTVTRKYFRFQQRSHSFSSKLDIFVKEVCTLNRICFIIYQFLIYSIAPLTWLILCLLRKRICVHLHGVVG